MGVAPGEEEVEGVDEEAETAAGVVEGVARGADAGTVG